MKKKYIDRYKLEINPIRDEAHTVIANVDIISIYTDYKKHEYLLEGKAGELRVLLHIPFSLVGIL